MKKVSRQLQYHEKIAWIQTRLLTFDTDIVFLKEFFGKKNEKSQQTTPKS